LRFLEANTIRSQYHPPFNDDRNHDITFVQKTKMPRGSSSGLHGYFFFFTF
jgi:hypothetical protein